MGVGGEKGVRLDVVLLKLEIFWKNICVSKEMRSGRRKASGSVVAEEALVAMVRGKKAWRHLQFSWAG